MTKRNSVTLAAGAFAGLATLWLFGCSLRRPAPLTGYPAAASAGPAGAAALANEAQTADGPGGATILRVAGDMLVRAELVDGEYRSGACRITTPLPEGYPAPTPPGAVELKYYPPVRRAGISGSMAPDWGMNVAFFPLFNHIKRREIAMTSPVEMNYTGLGAPGATRPSEWTMSFLYRTPELGPEGADPRDERILVEDTRPITVVAVGLRGPYKLERVKAALATLREWLAVQTTWKEAGDPRALFYNGPEVGSRDKWLEVQIPVVHRAGAAEPAAALESAD